MRNEKQGLAWLWYVAIVMAMFIVFGVWLWFWNSDYTGETKNGEFGDSFGSLNALFSGMAFACLVITVLMQRKELEYQRNELVETREVFKKQQAALELQAELSKQQLLNETFYEYVRAVRDSLGLVADSKSANVKGAAGLDNVAGAIKSRCRSLKQTNTTMSFVQLVCDPSDHFNEDVSGGVSILFKNLILAFEYLKLHVPLERKTENAEYLKAQLPRRGLLPLLLISVRKVQDDPHIRLLFQHGVFVELGDRGDGYERELYHWWADQMKKLEEV